MKLFVSAPVAGKAPIKVIRETLGLSHDIVIPTRQSADHDRSLLMDCDVCLADVSNPCFAVGMELGWANMLHSQIVGIHKSRSGVPEFIAPLLKTTIEYESDEDLQGKLFEWMQNYKWSYD